MVRGKIIQILLAGITLTACNLPGTATTIPISTSAAETVQAEMTSQVSTETPVSILTKPSEASLTLNDNSNCRSGPGTNFEKVTVIPEGSSVPILARSSEGTHYLVDPPDNAASCWVLGELGIVSGDLATVPQATASVSPNAGAPTRPSSFFYNYECSFGSPQAVTTTLTWGDAANNENGYRVYRYDFLIIELPPNSTSYVDETTVAVGDGLTYGIEAFNDAGVSTRTTISFSCSD